MESQTWKDNPRILWSLNLTITKGKASLVDQIMFVTWTVTHYYWSEAHIRVADNDFEENNINSDRDVNYLERFKREGSQKVSTDSGCKMTGKDIW